MIRTWTPESDNPKPPESGTDYHTVKAWFQQLRNLDDKADSIRLEIQRLRDNATKCTASMSGMPPGGSGYSDKVGSCAELVNEEEQRLAALKTETKLLRDEAIRRIEAIHGTKCSKLMQECMYGYYVQNKKQPVIAKSLGLPTENRVSLYIRWAAIYLAEIWTDLEASCKYHKSITG